MWRQEGGVFSMSYAKHELYHGSQRKLGTWSISYKAVAPLAMACDALAIFMSSELSALAYEYLLFGQPHTLLRQAGLAALMAALFIALGKARGLYTIHELLNFKSQAYQIALHWIGVFLFVTAIGFSIKTSETFSRGVVFIYSILAIAGLIASRAIWRVILADGLAVRRFSGRNIAIVTDHEAATTPTIFDVLNQHGLQSNKCFVLPADLSDEIAQRKVIHQAIASIRGSNIQEIVIAANLERWSTLKTHILDFHSIPLPISFLPTGPGADLLKLPLHKIGDTATIELQRGPRTLFERSIKRTIDIVVSSGALLCLLPLMLLTAIAIKMDFSGPIIFRQRRCGFNGREFTIYKFRTMSVLEDGDTISKAARNDKRVTRVGRWLRRTSIDELPQLINVLKGSMSIVGPRPHAVAHNAEFEKLVGKYVNRHHAKPGITGWAQVNGHRGSMETTAEIERRTAFDLWYVENWSLTLDSKIMFMTLLEVMRAENAY